VSRSFFILHHSLPTFFPLSVVARCLVAAEASLRFRFRDVFRSTRFIRFIAALLRIRAPCAYFSRELARVSARSIAENGISIRAVRGGNTTNN